MRDNEYLLDENKNKCAKILEIYQRGNPEHNLVSAYGKAKPIQPVSITKCSRKGAVSSVRKTIIYSLRIASSSSKLKNSRRSSRKPLLPLTLTSRLSRPKAGNCKRHWSASTTYSKLKSSWKRLSLDLGRRTRLTKL